MHYVCRVVGALKEHRHIRVYMLYMHMDERIMSMYTCFNVCSVFFYRLGNAE